MRTINNLVWLAVFILGAVVISFPVMKFALAVFAGMGLGGACLAGRNMVKEMFFL